MTGYVYVEHRKVVKSRVSIKFYSNFMGGRKRLVLTDSYVEESMARHGYLLKETILLAA